MRSMRRLFMYVSAVFFHSFDDRFRKKNLPVPYLIWYTVSMGFQAGYDRQGGGERDRNK